jgi:imidazolonepropionase-like amidohydrolase
LATRVNIPGATGGPLAPTTPAATIWEGRRSGVGRLLASGTRMIAGSDCGTGGIAHSAVIDELVCLRNVGMSAGQALAAATARCADAIGIGSATGRLAPGLRADVLVVDGNPIEDLNALRTPLAVFKSGQRVR